MSVFGTATTATTTRTNMMYDQLENISSLSYAALPKNNVNTFPYISPPVMSDKSLSIEKLSTAHWQNKCV